MNDRTTVVLIRHGQTEWNRIRRYQGHSDVPLNSLGRQQAELVAKRLATLPVDAVYSSDLQRAVQTATAIAAHHGLPVVQRAGFREIDFGLWEGLTYQQIMAGWPCWLTAMYARPSIGYAPRGEGFAALQRRAQAALRRCVDEQRGRTIVVVAHGGTLRALLCAALNKSIDEVWTIEQEVTAVNVLRICGDAVEVERLNDATHLAADGAAG